MLRPLILPAALALTTSLGSAPALAAGDSVTLRTSDLDLSSPAGRAELDKRIDRVASKMCSGEMTTGSNISSLAIERCKAAVHEEVSQKLARNTVHQDTAKLADKAR